MSKESDEHRAAIAALREAEAACAPEYDAMIAAQRALSDWHTTNKPANGWPRDWRAVTRIEYPEHLIEADEAANRALRAKRREVGYFEAVRRYSDVAYRKINPEEQRKD